jgi:hypothetical protein
MIQTYYKIVVINVVWTRNGRAMIKSSELWNLPSPETYSRWLQEFKRWNIVWVISDEALKKRKRHHFCAF